VASFDGVPLDVDVTVPARGSGPFPTIVLLHGWGADKTAYETTKAAPGTFSNVGLAKAGYAVVTPTARGFGRSCGQPVEVRTAGCERGWLHLADQRYEARDVQTLLGRLVDEGVAKASALGVSGGSYGGGEAMQLAFLKNRVRDPDGRFSPWTSPKGRRLSIAAAYPVIPWSDLTSAQMPNGRPASPSDPVGVESFAYLNRQYVGALATGFVAPKGADPGADLGGWIDLFNAGEPYGDQAKAILAEISTYHSSLSLLQGGAMPAPLLMLSGWTDDLFPPLQTLRVYDALRARSPKAPVWLQLDDFGHARGGYHAHDQRLLAKQGLAFFDTYLRRAKRPLPPPGSVLAFGQTCPNLDPDGLGPFRSASFDGLHKGRLAFSAVTQQTVISTGGDQDLALALNPKPIALGGLGGNPCATFPAAVAPETAVATKQLDHAATYLGLGRITADIRTVGPYGQLSARLWDVADGRQTLVDRSIYRLTADQAGTIAFDLHGNGYRFGAGHTIKLELVGDDYPTYRRSNDAFSVTVSRLGLELPTR
jgi:pimeloyl-ACP methyl ester carboxylesterase